VQTPSGAGGLSHHGPIAGIAAHGGWLATAGYDNRVILWDSHSRQPLARGCHDHLVNQCAFSSDGRWLVSASSDYSARVWALPSMQLQAVLRGHGDDVDMAVFSPDDVRIATCALDRCVRVFDLEGRCLLSLRGHTGNVLSLAWSKDGRELVTSSVDGTIRHWDTVHGVELRCTDLSVRTDSVEISAAGVVYAGDDFGRIAIIQGGELRFVQAHGVGIKKIALDSQRATLVSLSYDRTIAVWQVDQNGELTALRRSTLPDCAWARAAAVLPDGRIAVGTFGSSYALFDARDGSWDLDGVVVGPAINAVLEVERQIYAVGDAGRVWVDGAPAAELGSLCNFLVAAAGQVYAGGQLGRLFEAATGRVVYEHHAPLICAVAFERAGAPHLAVGSYTGEVLILAVERSGAAALVQTLAIYDNAVKGLSCSAGLLFSVCASTDIAWHRLDDGAPVRRVDQAHERIANACCAIGDGRFASVGRDRSLRLWDGEHTEAHASPHLNSVKCMAVNEDRTAVMTGCYGGTLAQFDLRERCWTSVHRPTASGISSITWDRRGQRFLAASYDGGIYAVAA
jgi:WD40 repeat protein